MAQPLIQRRAFTQIPVHDLRACSEWYRKVFQLEGDKPELGDTTVTLQDPAGKGTIVLWQCEPGITVGNGSKHIYAWKVKSINTVADTIQSMGKDCKFPRCEEGFATVTLPDPSGNLLFALQEPPDWGKTIGRKPEDEFHYFAHIDGVNVPVPAPRKNLWLTAEWYKFHLDAPVGVPNESNRDVGLLYGMVGRITDGNEHSKAHFVSNGRVVACHYFWTPDLCRAHARLKESGVQIESFDPEGGRLQFVDLNGNVVGLVQRPLDTVPSRTAVTYKEVSHQRPHRSLTRALGLVKGGAAKTLGQLGLLEEIRAKAIFDAAMEFAGGRYDKEVKVELFQGDWIAAFNRHANQATALRAAEIIAESLGKPRGTETMEPEEANLGMPVADAVATALQVATCIAIRTELEPALRRLAANLERRGGQEDAAAYSERIAQALRHLEYAAGKLTEVPLPSNVHPHFAAGVCRLLEEMVPIRVAPAESHAREASIHAFASINTALKASAAVLTEIAQGIRREAPHISESVYKVCLHVACSGSATEELPDAGFGPDSVLPLYAHQTIENIALLTSACGNLDKVTM